MIIPKKSLQQQSNYSQKSSSHFSSVNKFDFPIPSKNLPNTKSPPKPDSIANEKKQKQNEQTIRKARYYWHMRNQHHNERDKAKSRQKNIIKMQQEEKKQKIIDELMKKKMQLQKLEQQRQQAIKKHGEANEKAKKFNHDLEMKRLKSQQNAKQQQHKQLERYQTALVRVKSQKLLNQLHINRQLSTKRNQTRNRYKSRERQAAEQYKTQKQAYDKEMEDIRKQKQIKELQDKLAVTIKQKTGKTIDFQNTCYHNFAKNVLVLDDAHKHNTKASCNASPREFQRLSKERKSLKDQLAEENKQKSIQRGRQALKKLKEAKQYSKYLQEMQEQQKNYNFERIEAGKLNQFVGLKPETLKNHSRCKKYRAEEEFEKVFFTPQSDKHTLFIDYSAKGRGMTERTMNSDSRTQLTQRSSFSRQYEASQRKQNISSAPYDDSKNINTLPYNAKIHSIMLENSRPSYCRNLFEGNQGSKSYQAENKQLHEYNDPIALEYSMTQDQNEYF